MNSPVGQTASVAIPTPLGVFMAHFTTAGLARLEFPGAGTGPATPGHANPDWVARTSRALIDILRGAPHSPPPLDLRGGTEFQRAVWSALRAIPPGSTIGYQDLAREVGRPKAARAVGQACGANPIPVLIPCHRVLAANGKLGGFSGGLDWKRRLLAIEGFPSA